MAIRVAINGFGRIGRLVLRALHEQNRDDVQAVAINDLGSVAANAHLLKYDSVHGRFKGEIKTGDNWMDIGKGRIAVSAERDPAKLPWKDLEIDVALECTGLFTKREAAAKHIEAGAKRVPHLGPGRRRRHHPGDGRQQRPGEARAPGSVQRLLHHQLPGAGGLCAERGRRHRARLHDDDPCLYRRPEHGRHAAQGHAPRPRRRAQHDPDLDRRRQGDGPGAAGLAGQARRHLDPRADRRHRR